MIDQLTDQEPERNEGLVQTFETQLAEWDAFTYSYDSHERTQTIEIDWDACVAMEKDLDAILREQPYKALYNLENAAEEHLRANDDVDGEFEQYIRFVTDDAETKRIDELRSDDVDTLVHISGTVEQIYNKHDITTHAIFRCVSCGTRNQQAQKVVTDQLRYPSICVNEDCNNSSNSNFHLLDEPTVDKDHQLIKLSDEATAERQGEEIYAHLFDPFLDSVELGEQVTITAIPQRYRENKNDLTQERELIALGIDNGRESYELTDAERERFERLVEDEDVEQVLLNSLAPHIVGEDIEAFKRGVLYAIVSGDVSWMEDRADLNIAGIGDPAVGKTKILDFVDEAVSQSVLAEGGGSSKAGLLGMAAKDERTGRWYAETGPFFRYRDVMVDELADMDYEHITSLKNALEHQRHTITKGGVNGQTLTTTGSFIGTANPIDGTFTPHEPLEDQYDFHPAILSRFDLIYIIQDQQDEDEDRHKAMAMMNRYQEAAADDPDHDRLSKTEFGKFVEFLKEREPAPPGEAEAEFLADQFASMREDDAENIDLRKISSINRIAVVSARLNGRDRVTKQDLQRGFEMFVEYISQMSDVNIDKSMLWSGKNEQQREAEQRVQECVETLELADDTESTRDEVERRLVMSDQFDQETIRWAVESQLEQDRIYEQDGQLHTAT